MEIRTAFLLQVNDDCQKDGMVETSLLTHFTLEVGVTVVTTINCVLSLRNYLYESGKKT